MRLLPTLMLLLTLSMLASCTSAPTRPAGGAFVEREIRVDGALHRYQVFVPARSTTAAKPPVILFLHGSGERGDDNRRQVAVGLGPYVRQHMDDFPAIVVFPQGPEGREWSDNTELSLATLDAAITEFDGDPARVYLTGMSMGGYGTWDLAVRQPGIFAALVPICAGVTSPGDRRPTLRVTAVDGAADPFAAVAAKVKDIPVWMFHGARDDLVLPEQSRRMEAALKAAGARDARYTEFPDANHNSWDPAYSQTPELWEWLFAQRR